MNNEEIFQQYNEGKLVIEIAESLNIPYSQVMNRITYGIKKGKIIRRSKKNKRDQDARSDKRVDEKTIYEMYNNGLTFKQIATYFGVHTTTITPYINEGKAQGLLEKKREKNKKIGDLDIQKIKDLKFQGISIKDIACQFEVTNQTVRNICKKYTPKDYKVNNADINPSKRFVEFIQLLTISQNVSKADIQEKLNIRESAFYKYLADVRKLFKIEFVGSIGGNAYYSIDKKSIAKYFNIKTS